MADEEALHLLVHEEAGGSVWMTSPNLPGLLYGRESAEDFWDDLEEVLRDVDAPVGPRLVYRFLPVGEVDGNEVVVAVPQDARKGERLALVELFLGTLNDDEQVLDFVSEDTFRLPTGEIMVFAAMPEDTLGTVNGALFPSEAALVITPYGDPEGRGVCMVTVASDLSMDDDDPRRLLTKTLPDTATVAELIEGLPVDQRDRRRQLVTVS